jgi:predicted ATPase/class 3 adenylate cyclase
MTDVEDSTRLWESDRVGMAASLALHDSICRQTAADHGGYVFSTAGDAFAIAFSTPNDAVAASLAVQRALAAADWPGPSIRVRIGVHTGTADERDGDYFGPTVNRAARVMSAGHGGQILISEVTADLVGANGGDVNLIDRGSHRLSGISEPDRLFEVSHPELTPVSAPLRTGELRQTNLPDPLSSFVGRAHQLAEIERRFGVDRLVVLTGVGGTGKTRLAIEAGRSLLASYPDGVWIVELAPILDPALVMSTIGDVFGLRPGEGSTITDVVLRHLWSRRLLLAVDNCEHVRAAAAEAIQRILDGAPNVRVLATSRESLGIDGESLVDVPSLGVPDGSRSVSESVQLFLDRAAAAVPGFDRSGDETAAIERICRRVDGIPLGVELAAARLRAMSARELADRLEDSFAVLAGQAKSSLPRHRTLDATIDWSYDLLEPAERALFRRVSVCSGGFDLAAAEAVAGNPDESAEAFDLIESLVDKSLVTSVRTEAGVRFRMLEPVRQYARRQLDDAGEVQDALLAHASHFASFGADASSRTRGRDQAEWSARIDAEYDNIRLAFHTMREVGDHDRYLGLVFDLFMYWAHAGLHLEAIETSLAVLEHPSLSADPHATVKGWFVVATMGAETTSPAAIGHAREGLEIARRLGEPNAIGRMELALGAAIRHATTDPEYLEHLLAARLILDESPTPSWWEPDWDRAFTNLLFAGYLPSTDERVGEHAEVATTTFERVGDGAMLGATLVETAGARNGILSDQAIGDLQRAVEIFESVRSRYWQGHARMTLGTVLTLRDRPDEAAPHLSAAADQLDDLGDLNCWAASLRRLAESESALGMWDSAGGHLAEVIARFDLLPMQEVALPRTLDAVAKVALGAGDHEVAARVLGCAEQVPFDVETVIPRASVLEGMASELDQVLGTMRFEELRAEGAELNPLQCLNEARVWLVG